MKKSVFRLLCVSLLIVLLISMTACSNEKKALLGAWNGEFDLAAVINEAMVASNQEMQDYITVDSFVISVSMTFHEDDTYVMLVDPTSVQLAFEGMKKELRSGLEAYFLDVLEAEGIDVGELGMSLDEILEYVGVSMDDMIEENMGGEAFDQMISEMNSKGKFEAKDGKLYLSAGLDAEVDRNQYEEYTLEGDVLTIHNGISDEEKDDYLKKMYPMVFHRAG